MTSETPAAPAEGEFEKWWREVTMVGTQSAYVAPGQGTYPRNAAKAAWQAATAALTARLADVERERDEARQAETAAEAIERVAQRLPGILLNLGVGASRIRRLAAETVREIVTPPPPASHEAARLALARINGIRNSIVGTQTINWSEHIYPLVAALEAAGISGMSYPEAREYFGTLIERTNKAESALTAAQARIAELEAMLSEADAVIFRAFAEFKLFSNFNRQHGNEALARHAARSAKEPG